MNSISLNDYNSKIKRVLITEQQIQEQIKIAGKKITRMYDGTPFLIIGILKGSFVFMADLCRAIDAPCEIEFMRVSSYYNGMESTGKVDIVMDVGRDISDYNVIIAEDIIDTGRTLNEVVKILKERNPKSLKVVTLLDKPDRRIVDFNADMALFTIEDHFVIGYGLDCAEQYRNLPYIAEFNTDCQ